MGAERTLYLDSSLAHIAAITGFFDCFFEGALKSFKNDTSRASMSGLTTRSKNYAGVYNSPRYRYRYRIRPTPPTGLTPLSLGHLI